MPPEQKRAVCIQTAGCYGQSGNGGQGTDRGRGAFPLHSHHPHRGRLPSSERLVTRLQGHLGRGDGGPSGTAATCGHTPLYGAVTGVEELDDAFRFRAVLLCDQRKTCLTWPCVRGEPLGFHRMSPPVTFPI